MSRLLKSLRVLQLQTFFASKGLEKSSQFIPALFEVYKRPFTSSSSSGYDDSSDGFPDKHEDKWWQSERLGDFPDVRDSYDQLGSRLKSRDWKAKKLNSFEKNFYICHPSVSDRSQEEIDGFYQKHNISVSDSERPTPICHFQEANFPDPINQRLTEIGWGEPTPIQSIGWPLALSGKNLVGIAQTGSGKTLGFVLPALVHIKHQRPIEKAGEPIALVLAPTRELAQQIQGVSQQFCRPMGMRSTCVFGGQSKVLQARYLLKGQEIIVATPGRLLDFVQDELINLEKTTYVVLDEADRMLDMGFEPQIRKILNQIRPDRQILMWTATWPADIQSLAHDYLGDFTQVVIGSTGLTVNPNIEQTFRITEERDKFSRLYDVFRSIFEKSKDPRSEKILVFANTQIRAEVIARRLQNERINARDIHGKKSQSYRDSVLESFRNGRLNVLVATDVAARGLDVDDIKVVINYDLPTCVDDYIHRIGRTARASKTGVAISFCTEESSIVPDIISLLRSSDIEVDPDLTQLALFQSKFGKKGGARSRSQFSDRRSYPGPHQRRGGYRSMPMDSGRRFFPEERERRDYRRPAPRHTRRRSYSDEDDWGGPDRGDRGFKGKNLIF